MAIAFRGNVEVPDRDELMFSFHGYRGMRRQFDIRVANPMCQRSLQSYHGALQVFKMKDSRSTGVHLLSILSYMFYYC